MKIGIDFDDVLIDFNTGFIGYHNTLYGTSVNREDIYTFENSGHIFGITQEELLKRYDEFKFTDKHIETMPVQGAKEAIQVLSKSHELYIITSRSHDLRELTEAWLQKNFPGLFKTVHFTNHFLQETNKKKTKAEICNEEGISIFIEDSPTHIRALLDSGKRVLLFDTPWNQDVPTDSLITRVYSWEEIVKEIEEINSTSYLSE